MLRFRKQKQSEHGTRLFRKKNIPDVAYAEQPEHDSGLGKTFYLYFSLPKGEKVEFCRFEKTLKFCQK